MKKRPGSVRSFLSGVLVTVLAFGLMGSAVAASVVNKELYYNGIQIRLNGKTLLPKDASGNPVEPFIIDGTTYLPVRAVGEALGLNVSWDGASNTVILGNDPEKGQPAKWLGEMETFKGYALEYKIERDGQYNDYFTANNESTYDRRYVADSSASYLLKSQYTKFTGTWYLTKYGKNDAYGYRFLVYVDEKLVYTSPTVTAGVEPIPFSVNVSGAYQMEVVMQGSGNIQSDNPSWSDYSNTSCACIADAALWTD